MSLITTKQMVMEAVQWDGTALKREVPWLNPANFRVTTEPHARNPPMSVGDAMRDYEGDDVLALCIATGTPPQPTQTVVAVGPGDWVLRLPDGSLQVCSAELFDAAFAVYLE